MSTTTSVKDPSDPTFRSYSVEQAKYYGSQRLSYDSAIYNTVLDHHLATGGHFDLALDVGCGPGNATRDIAPSFDHAIGVDAGAAMIEAARALGGKTKSGSDIRFEVSPGESFSNIPGIEPGSVDLITVGMAAHWFEMEKFWVEAAKVLKPGGTVAIWTQASAFCHPSTPNAAKVMKVLLHFERETLAPYELPANRISRDMYDNLALPWTIPTPVTAFPERSFIKHEYDREGVLTNGVSFFGGDKETSLESLEKGLGTASMVSRWREANPELVGSDRDIVKQFIRELREALGPGQERIVQGSGTAILLFKKYP